MLEFLIIVYLCGCVATALIFAAMLWLLYSHNTSDSRDLAGEFRRMAPEYIFYWPWRMVLFPLFIKLRGLS